MPITRRTYDAPMSRAAIHRTGGSVNLFNYNPSIAGGSIAVHRFKHLHYQGKYLRHKEHEHLVASTTGTGLHAPGHAAHGGGTGNYQGLGATGRTAMHPITEDKKRLHEMIGKMMHPTPAKRARL